MNINQSFNNADISRPFSAIQKWIMMQHTMVTVHWTKTVAGLEQKA